MKTFPKVTKASINKMALAVSENWITNGHWMMRKGKADNSPIFASAETACTALNINQEARWTTKFKDEYAESCLGKGDRPYAYTVTPWTYDSYSATYRLLQGEGYHGLVDERYAKLFGLERGDVLYSKSGNGLSIFVDEHETFAIMPVSPQTAEPSGLPGLDL